MSNDTSRKRSATGATLFIVSIPILAIAGFMIPDYFGVRQGLVGTISMVVIILLVFYSRIGYYAISLLPQDLENRYEEGFYLILQHYFGGGPQRGADSPHEGVPPSLFSFRAGVVDSHIVLALGKGDGFSRAAGPGYVKLRPGEFIKHVIDLRDHRRSQTISGVTRDGIPFESRVVVTFRVRRLDDGDAGEDNPYPHDETAIFQVSYFSSYGEGDSEIPWLERVAPLAASELVAELSNYTLDEVYRINEPERANSRAKALELQKVKQVVAERLQEMLQPHGIELVDVEVGDLVLPADVREQRIANWQADWQRQAFVERAKGNAIAVQLMEEARAKAEVELINKIVDSIEEAGWSDQVSLADVIALATMETVRDATTDSQLQLPSQTMQTVTQLQSLATSPRLRTDSTIISSGRKDESGGHST